MAVLPPWRVAPSRPNPDRTAPYGVNQFTVTSHCNKKWRNDHDTDRGQLGVRLWRSPTVGILGGEGVCRLRDHLHTATTMEPPANHHHSASLERIAGFESMPLSERVAVAERLERARALRAALANVEFHPQDISAFKRERRG